ncbi:MAG: GNAT family N-acetyltransferase [Coriobacteriales bacterium]|jgi:N-acetylglutamate synthase-like GNAT family acetyltransferase|nr:GNAT family N-acetyltransferase [Coriobacteriales bacterium]
MSEKRSPKKSPELLPEMPRKPQAALFTVRKAQASDLPHLQLLLRLEQMPVLSDTQLLASIVAVNSEDQPVGAVRIVDVRDTVNPQASASYVYPVVVFREWRGFGVGRVLLAAALREHGELRLVACRESRDFYPRCGFEPIAWDKIAGTIAHDCEACPQLASCAPQPFAARLRQGKHQGEPVIKTASD